MEPSSWEEALDVDDSDLPSLALLRPCKQRRRHGETDLNTTTAPSHPPQTLDFSHSQSQTVDSFPQRLDSGLQPTVNTSFRVIPGPAGIFQTAMLRKARDRRNVLNLEESPMPTQEYIRRAVEDPEEDADFKRNPWISAIEFVSGVAGCMVPSSSLGDINKFLKNGKLDQVVAVVKSSTPNGFGDLMVTLKDPMGTVPATIHQKVFTDGEFGKDISVGSVLILHNVSVFSPSPSTHYLNITVRNLVKVFHKDCEPSLKLNFHGYPIVDSAPSADSGGDATMLQRAYPPERGADGIMNGIRPSGNANQSLHYDDQRGKVHAVSSSSSQSSKRSNLETHHKIDLGKGIFKEADIIESVVNEQMEPIGGGNLFGSLKCTSKVVGHGNDKEAERTDAVQKQIEPKMTNSSLPQWTDEQLNELLAGDCEDDLSLF